MCSTPEVALGEEPGSARQPRPLSDLRPIPPRPVRPAREDGDPSDPPVTLDSLAKAIDELAAASCDGTAPPELAERIARLWAMVSDLDPELARRRAAYEHTEIPPG